MSLYRRANSKNYWCRFTVRGREVRQSTGTAVRAQAEEYETHLRSRYWRQVKLGESFHTFAEAGERWLAETQKRTKDKDAKIIDWWNYERDKAGAIVAPRLADVALADITREVLDAAKAKLAEGLSTTTVNYYLGVLRAILRKAQSEWGWLESVPKFPMFRRELGEPLWLTRAQFRELVKLLPPHMADVARLAVATGLRKSNITGLTWDRVDLRRRTAYIPSTQAKAGRGIPVALNADAIAVLERWKGRHPRWVIVNGDKPVREMVDKRWRRAAVAIGVPALRFHDLRHTWASWQVQAETPLSVLQEMGGWASFEMVRRYAHLSPGHLKKYANRTLVGTPRRRARAK